MSKFFTNLYKTYIYLKLAGDTSEFRMLDLSAGHDCPTKTKHGEALKSSLKNVSKCGSRHLLFNASALLVLKKDLPLP